MLRKWREYVEQAPNEVTSVCVTVTFPGNPQDDQGRPRPAGRDRRRRLRRRRGRGHAGDAALARARHRPLRHVRPDAVHRRAIGLRPALPAQSAARVLEGASPERSSTTRRSTRSPPGHSTDRRRRRSSTPSTWVARSPTLRPDDTAFPERSAPYLISIDGQWTDAKDDADNVAWVRSAFEDSSRSGTAACISTSLGGPTRRQAPA